MSTAVWNTSLTTELLPNILSMSQVVDFCCIRTAVQLLGTSCERLVHAGIRRAVNHSWIMKLGAAAHRSYSIFIVMADVE